MTNDAGLSLAKRGDTIQGADLQTSIDALLALAASLDERIDTLADVGAVQALGRVQQDLRSWATSLADQRITLLSGLPRVTADHVNAAAQYAMGVISDIADTRRGIQKIGNLLDFFAVVVTGDGAKIVQAAATLKSQLDTA